MLLFLQRSYKFQSRKFFVCFFLNQMEILDLKTTIPEMKNSLEGLNISFEMPKKQQQKTKQ